MLQDQCGVHAAHDAQSLPPVVKVKVYLNVVSMNHHSKQKKLHSHLTVRTGNHSTSRPPYKSLAVVYLQSSIIRLGNKI